METIPTELLNTPFREWQLNLTTVLLAVMLGGRAWTALVKGGGLMGVWRSLVYGVTPPSEPKQSAPPKISSTLPVLLMAGLLFIAAGCAGPKRIEYKTLASIGAAVDSSMNAAADGYWAGKIDDAGWASISEKHRKFRLAYNQAVSAAKLSPETVNTDTVNQLWFDIIATIKEVTK